MDPELFGKYRILSKLAGGGMGRVYLALETETNQRVALKLID
jgi:serine/threonine protein kinase